MFVNNIIFSFEKIRPRMVFLLFNAMIFVFLLSRPTISFFRGDKWWHFNDSSVIFSMLSLYISLLCLFIGALIAEQLIRKKEKNILKINAEFRLKKDDKKFIQTLQTVTFIAFFVTFIFFMAEAFEKLIFMNGRDYADYYVEFSSQLPYFVSVAGSMMKYCLCIFLATLPSKRKAFIPLALYVLSEVPSLIIGMRNPIVLNLLFVIVYYLARDYIEGNSKWFGKIERALVAFMAPISLLFLSVYNYAREGSKLVSTSIIDLIVDFFYKQGVSYDVLNIGYNAIPNLPDIVSKNYTFGSIIDYFAHNTFAQTFFGATDLGSGNNLTVAVYGNSFAHSMSYTTRTDYLDGHGWGTSYILENYADFGYWGVILFSLCLGAFLIYLLHWFKNGWFTKTVVLIVLTKLFFTPRAEAVSSVAFLFTMQFWACLIMCYFVARLCCKEYSFISSGRLKILKKSP